MFSSSREKEPGGQQISDRGKAQKTTTSCPLLSEGGTEQHLDPVKHNSYFLDVQPLWLLSDLSAGKWLFTSDSDSQKDIYFKFVTHSPLGTSPGTVRACRTLHSPLTFPALPSGGTEARFLAVEARGAGLALRKCSPPWQAGEGSCWAELGLC